MQKKEKQLESFIHRENVPNLLFYGPYQNGKEQLCQMFIQKLYPTPEATQKYVLWLNCLTTTGIQHLKEMICLFSMQIIQKISGISFKTIVLQYAEYLTYDSQYSLRRTIEQYNHNTRFILLCEKKQKLLQPICSRFVHYYVNDIQIIPYKTIDDFPYSKFKSYWKKYEHIVSNPETTTLWDLYTLAKTLYQEHFFARELLSKCKKNMNYHTMCLLFDKYSVLFRNETLCIFHILCVFRNKSKLQILELY